jgi:hypothetical protein
MTPDNISVIGITGFKRSGKDTVGDYLCTQHGFTKLSYASALKIACQAIFSFTDEQLHGDEEKEKIDEYWKHSPRDILQKVGTELFREKLPEVCEHINNDIWIRSVERQIKTLHNLDPSRYNKFVITDVRYENEAEFVKKMNGKVLRINRFDFEMTEENLSKLHKSESTIMKLDVDEDIENKSTLHELYSKVDALLFNNNN